ncbi:MULTISPECIES: DUF432 domain-containing protein [Nitrosopumilus]|uniref:DUF432 domain-containing protein n=1 Tax=Nitrosopumilus piranensis TaxID=1582439 RepID=A0A0C5BVX0_9ARCH|nr:MULTISPECIES: DUF432 domain-containing protein [Nitrosopumilus]AJM92394.1 hypothetical protein NPIRD3C_1182 [Nitrosopumilus piranensis]KAF6244311.1 hypothetical protein C6989_08485 [Nitrosopumilus sp. b2]
MSEESSDFAKYGSYEITDSLNLTFPGTEIKIRKVGNNVFSYARNDSEDNFVEKLIPTKSEKLKIEITPIRPLNFPARRTNYVYLELETPIFLHEGSSAAVFVRCPIEIGVYYIHETHENSLDCFTCDSFNARFCLYGSPESGTLCKYYKSEIVESYEDSVPYVNGVLQISLNNHLQKGVSIGKIVFPISDNSIYYKGSRAIIDSITAELKKKLTIEIIDIQPKSIETNWKKSPTYEKIETAKRMDMGVD